MFEVAGYALLLMLASLVGVISVWKQAGKIIEKNLHFLVSFSAGVFLVVAYELSMEITAHSSSVQSGVVWILVGVLSVYLIFKFLPEFHHHHDDRHIDHTHSTIDARRILLGDGIHNIGDGILLATSFAISSTLGMITTLGIFVHELVQEVSQFFVLRQAGYSTKKALKLNFLVSGTILVGALGGFFLIDTFELIKIPLLGFAAGSFLVVVFNDLIPHSIKSAHSNKHHIKHVVWFLVGLLFMSGLNYITEGSHAQSSGDISDTVQTEQM